MFCPMRPTMSRLYTAPANGGSIVCITGRANRELPLSTHLDRSLHCHKGQLDHRHGGSRLWPRGAALPLQDACRSDEDGMFAELSAASARPGFHPGVPGFARYRAATGGSLFLDPEYEAAADSVGFDEAHQYFLAEPVDPAGTAPDQSLGSLVADIIIAGQGRYRDQPVGAAFPQPHEEA